MKQLAAVLMSVVWAFASPLSGAETACRQVVVPGTVAAQRGELTLAELLLREGCAQLREAAARVSLGTAPQVGSGRVLEGGQIRGRLEELVSRDANLNFNFEEPGRLKIPERIVVERGGALKSCAAIALVVARATPASDLPRGWRENLNCAAAGGVAEHAALELTKTSWNAGLKRWEFALRCVHPERCVPFLVWVHDDRRSFSQVASSHGSRGEGPKDDGSGSAALVERGQTATLTWEQSGIRIVLPVTCLDAGAAGQLVRVRFQNAPGILRAEVVGKAMLRAKL